MPHYLNGLKNKSTQMFFTSDHVRDLGNKFVVWIDLMGVRDALMQNQKMPAVWRGELAALVFKYINENKAEPFIVGDGVVVMSDNEDYLKEFTFHVMRVYAKANLNNYRSWETNFHRFVRAGWGSGRVYEIDMEEYLRDYHGDFPFSSDFDNSPFGPGPVRAFSADHGSPLSIQMHEDSPLIWWQEVEFADNDRERLLEVYQDYFDWYAERDRYNYKPYERNHHEFALSYFNGSDFGFSFDTPDST